MKKILLIDDDEISNFINEQVIKNCGFVEEIIVCISAVRALKLLEDYVSDEELQLPEIILLDIRMPIMDGFGFLEAFKKFPPRFTEGIKIAMLTSSLEEGDIQRSFLHKNVVDFINKPLTEEKVTELAVKLKLV
jgi:CheY-like chemotaxis protein